MAQDRSLSPTTSNASHESDRLLTNNNGPAKSTIQQNDERELTFRAVACGVGIGVLLAAANMQFGLQSGWISMLSLQSALVGYGLFKVAGRLGWLTGKGPFTAKENIVLQTTAVATGTMPLAAGLVGVIPALGLLNPEKDHTEPITLSGLELVGWCFSVAFFGVIFAVPLRKQVIIREKLVFPSGTATARLISVLHGKPLRSDNNTQQNNERHEREQQEQEQEIVHDNDNDNYNDQEHQSSSLSTNQYIPDPREAREVASSWKMLIYSFVLSAIYIFITLAFPVFYSLPIFDIFGAPLAHKWLWWFTPSPSYIGQGIIMGLPVCLSMNLGMIVGWAILSPISYFTGWAPAEPNDSVDGARGWILWPALAIMMAESVVSLSGVVVTTISDARQRKSKIESIDRDSGAYESLLPQEGNDHEGEQEGNNNNNSNNNKPIQDQDSLTPNQVLIWLTISTIFCIIIVGAIFGQDGIQWWATLIAVLLACIFSLLGVRSLGQTDLNPVSAIGKISQIIFGAIQPGNLVANIIAGGISEAGAQQAGDLMQDLKTGHLHGASPRAQFVGQMIGSLASVFVSSGLYILYRNTYDMPSPAYPIPTAGIWLNLARLVNDGVLPPKTTEAMVLFGIIFMIIGIAKAANELVPRQHQPRWLRLMVYLPSGIPFAIGFVNTPQFSMARLIGGIIGYVWTRRKGTGNESSGGVLSNTTLIVMASGLVLGEGFGSVVGLSLRSMGVEPISCFGCNINGGGYCGGC